MKLTKKQKTELSKFSDLELCQEVCDRLGFEEDNDGQVVIYTGFHRDDK